MLDALLADDSATRVQILQQAVENDPALALWAVCQMQATALPTLNEVARWLAVCPTGEASAVAGAAQPRESSVAGWDRLALRSLNLAARSSALGEQSVDRSRCQLLGLVLDAPAWLSQCGPRVTLSARGGNRGCLPTWLTRLIRAVRFGKRPGPTAAVVRQAVADWERGEVDRIAAKSRSVASWRVVECDENIQAARRLACLTRKLTRLEQLENDFDTRLREEKVAALKEFAYGASHELNNPLANISSRAQTLLRDEDDPERCRRLASINTQAFRAHEMISDLMLFARPPALRLIETDLVGVLQRVVDEFAEAARQQGTELRMIANTPIPAISVDADHLTVALCALCRNALESLVSGGQVLIDGRFVSSSTRVPLGLGRGDQVCISVSDDGPGIAPEVRRHLFDPYFSGREAGRGLGLGLCKTWRVIDEHGGLIEVERGETAGATFRLWLPYASAEDSLQQAS